MVIDPTTHEDESDIDGYPKILSEICIAYAHTCIEVMCKTCASQLHFFAPTPILLGLLPPGIVASRV